MSDELQKALAGVRAEIDGIDAELLRLLNQRARCAQKVGEIKAEHGEAGHIYRPEREAQVLRRLQESNPGPLSRLPTGPSSARAPAPGWRGPSPVRRRWRAGSATGPDRPV